MVLIYETRQSNNTTIIVVYLEAVWYNHAIRAKFLSGVVESKQVKYTKT